MSDGAASGSSLAVLLATASLGRGDASGDGAEQRGGGVAYAAEIGPRSSRDRAEIVQQTLPMSPPYLPHISPELPRSPQLCLTMLAAGRLRSRRPSP